MQAPDLPAIATGFVRKLYRILDDQESAAVISWDTDGLSFVMVDCDALEENVLPRYFRGRLSAFRQQLKEHSFALELADQGQERYRHPFFRRGCPEELNQITHTPLPRKRPPRKKKRKQPEDTAIAATAESDTKVVKIVKVVKSSSSRMVYHPLQQEPAPEFRHATIDSVALATNPLFAADDSMSGFAHGLTMESLSMRPADPTAPLTQDTMLTKEEPMSADVMDELLSLLNTSLSTDGIEAVAAAAVATSGNGANSTSSTGNIFAEGRPPVVLPPLPPGIVENGQFSDDTLNNLMRWAASSGC